MPKEAAKTQGFGRIHHLGMLLVVSLGLHAKSGAELRRRLASLAQNGMALRDNTADTYRPICKATGRKAQR